MKKTIALIAASALLTVTVVAQSPTPTPTPGVAISIQATPPPSPASLIITLSGSDTQTMLAGMLSFITAQLTAEGKTVPTLPPLSQVKGMVSFMRTPGGSSRTIIKFFPVTSGTTSTSGS